MNLSYTRKFENERSWLCVAAVLVGLAFALSSATPSHAQALGWEGETGVFVTPLAYTASAENQKIHAVTAYHFFGAGPVIGDFDEASIELGIGKRLEFGYTHEFHAFGNDMSAPTNQLSPLWQNGFEIFNGKFQLVPENYAKTKWVPAISAGFIARTDVRNVGNYVEESKNASGMSGKSDGDIYVVATKVVPTKPIPIVLNFGVRGTNAELWGMGGNAPNWQARAFGAVAFVFKGPAKSTIIFGSEASQQPHHPYGFDQNVTSLQLNIPTTLTYCVRFLPSPKHKLNFDFGIAQVAGNIYNTPATGIINLQARHQAGFQVSYGF
ncbi:MAG: DUF3034 family protein [Terriglobales bacterium]|jgi:hypothetical protein